MDDAVDITSSDRCVAFLLRVALFARSLNARTFRAVYTLRVRTHKYAHISCYTSPCPVRALPPLPVACLSFSPASSARCVCVCYVFMYVWVSAVAASRRGRCSQRIYMAGTYALNMSYCTCIGRAYQYHSHIEVSRIAPHSNQSVRRPRYIGIQPPNRRRISCMCVCAFGRAADTINERHFSDEKVVSILRAAHGFRTVRQPNSKTDNNRTE